LHNTPPKTSTLEDYNGKYFLEDRHERDWAKAADWLGDAVPGAADVVTIAEAGSASQNSYYLPQFREIDLHRAF